MKLTVVIPAYNVHNTIKGALDSIPKNKNVNIIISDDASTKPYDYLLSEYDNLKIVRSEVNAGAGVARNRGMAAVPADTDWLCFLDADDCFTIDIYNFLLENIEENLDIIFSNIYMQKANTILYSTQDAVVHGVFFNKKFLDKKRLRFHPQLRIYEDVYFNKIARYLTKNIKEVNITTYELKYNENSTTAILQQHCNQDKEWFFQYPELQYQLLLAVMLEKQDYHYYADIQTMCSILAEGYNMSTNYIEKLKQVHDFSSPIKPKYKVSVIIPLYNSHKYIEKTLDKFYAQMEKYQGTFEVICTDDNSENNDYEYLRKYSNLTIVYNNVRKYMGGNRNRALRLAQGEWIWFLDHDDEKSQEGIDFFMQNNWDKYNVIELGCSSSGTEYKSEPCLCNYIMHGCIYKTNFLRKYNCNFLEDLQTSEDVYLHRYVDAIIQHYKLQDTIFKNGSILFGIWKRNERSTFNQLYNNRQYEEEFFFSSIKATVEACRINNNIDIEILKQYFQQDFNIHLYQIENWKKSSLNFKKSNIKVMLGIFCWMKKYDSNFLKNNDFFYCIDYLETFYNELTSMQREKIINEIIV